MVKNCDRGLENAALGLRPRAVFSRPRSQFFTIRTSQPANNIYIYPPRFGSIQKLVTNFSMGFFPFLFTRNTHCKTLHLFQVVYV